MTSRKRTGVGALLAGMLVIAGLGLAVAQDRGEGEGDGQTGDNAELPVVRRANLSGPEQIAEGERIETRGTQISRRVAAMLDEARRERDIIRITCLNDKLTQVNANLRTVDQRLTALHDAVRGSDDSRRNHEFTVLTVLGQKFGILEQEANQCVGQDIYETGTTRVITTIDPRTPVEDPNLVPVPPGITVPFIPTPMSGAT